MSTRVVENYWCNFRGRVLLCTCNSPNRVCDSTRTTAIPPSVDEGFLKIWVHLLSSLPASIHC